MASAPTKTNPEKNKGSDTYSGSGRNRRTDKLNDLIQKEPAEKLSMKMLKTAKKIQIQKNQSISGTSFRTCRD